jgi:hypothetical protein
MVQNSSTNLWSRLLSISLGIPWILKTSLINNLAISKEITTKNLEIKSIVFSNQWSITITYKSNLKFGETNNEVHAN